MRPTLASKLVCLALEGGEAICLPSACRARPAAMGGWSLCHAPRPLTPNPTVLPCYPATLLPYRATLPCCLQVANAGALPIALRRGSIIADVTTDASSAAKIRGNLGAISNAVRQPSLSYHRPFSVQRANNTNGTATCRCATGE